MFNWRSLLIFFFLVHSIAVAACPQDSIKIEIRTDASGSETSWELYDQNTSTVIANGSGYGDNTLYTQKVCVSSTGCYTFIIYDFFGDGMCCVYGPGYYHVYYNQTLVRSGGVFDFSESTFGIGNNCPVSTSISTDTVTYTPQELVSDVLLGSCVESFNVTYTGANRAIGYFANGGALGMDSGILITTGSASNAQGPNNTSSAFSILMRPGDSDLDLIAGTSTRDAAALEFDFVSSNDSVWFNYIFASEEYPEFVCSIYNDAFAFLVSGPGYAPNTNVALIPGTSTRVAINSVNSGSAGGFNNAANCISLAYSSYYRNNLTPALTQYDAFTDVLTATMVVVPCDTYHIKLVIGDVTDYAYDSGVFIEAGSFTGGQSIGVDVTTTEGTKNTHEGCADGQFNFFREGNSSNTNPIVVNFTLSGTATEGADYQAISHNVTIPANQDSAAVTITSVLDALTEGSESIIITYQDACACGLFKSDTLFIFDNSPIAVSITGPGTTCPGQGVTLTANGSGSSSSPLQYQWSSGQSIASITVNPASSATYTVTVTDACGGQTATASHPVAVVPAINASFTTNSPQCLSQIFNFTNTSTGGNPGSITFFWDFGDATNAALVNVSKQYANPGTYDVMLVADDGVCAPDSITLPVVVIPSDSTFEYQTSCNPADTGNVELSSINQFGCDSVHTIVTTLMVCSNGDACTVDSCANGSCAYPPIVCNDNDACTTDACAGGSCDYTLVSCDDGDLCTTDNCVGGTCNHAVIPGCNDACDTLVCVDANPCTVDDCFNGSCTFTAVTCDDGDGCTADACTAGICVYTPMNCDDADPCTTDQCLNGICHHPNATISSDSLVIKWWFSNCCCR